MTKFSDLRLALGFVETLGRLVLVIGVPAIISPMRIGFSCRGTRTSFCLTSSSGSRYTLYLFDGKIRKIRLFGLTNELLISNDRIYHFLEIETGFC